MSLGLKKLTSGGQSLSPVFSVHPVKTPSLSDCKRAGAPWKLICLAECEHPAVKMLCMASKPQIRTNTQIPTLQPWVRLANPKIDVALSSGRQ